MLTSIWLMPALSTISLGAAAEDHDRLAARLVANFDVAPTDSLDPAGAERLEDRLLRGPAAGEMLRRQLAALAVLNLVVACRPG